MTLDKNVQKERMLNLYSYRPVKLTDILAPDKIIRTQQLNTAARQKKIEFKQKHKQERRKKIECKEDDEDVNLNDKEFCNLVRLIRGFKK